MVMRRNLGLSLIELLISIAIIATLSGGAYMAYTDYIRESKKVVATATMRKLVEALQAYNSDHARPYTTSEANHLVGPYLHELPEDPWGNEYIVDYFFGRVISTGEDLSLNTMVPFHPFYGLARTEPLADDLVAEYQHIGMITCQHNGALTVMNADGVSPAELVQSNVRAVAGTANGSLILYTDGSNDLHLIEMTGNTYSNNVQTLVPGVGTIDGSTKRQIAWSCDSVRYALICEYKSASAVMVGVTTGSSPAFVACTVPLADPIMDVTFSGDGRLLYMNRSGADFQSSIFVAAAAAGSSVTTHCTLAGSPILRHVTASRDGRYLAVDDGTVVHILRTSSGSPMTDLYGAPITFGGGSDPDSTWPAFSPDSRKVCFTADGSEIHGASLLASQYKPVRLDEFPGSFAVTHISWD